MIGPRWIAAALGALLLGSLAAEVGAQRNIVLQREKRQFDHDAHAALVKKAGEKKIGCDGDCHTTDASGTFQKRGKREHARCMGCHEFTTSKRRLRTEVGRTCFACHGKKLKYRPSELGRVYAETDADYATVYSHRRHTMTGARSGRQCEGCHGKFGDSPPRTKGALSGGHRFCSGCHERGVEPLMHSCDGCHVGEDSPRFETPVVAKKQAKSKYAVSKRFSHPRHAREDRVGTKGRECLTCHANIAEAKSDTSIPLPTMKGCYDSCHDGKKAFSATAAQCSRCHAQTGSKPTKVEEVLRFRHTDHAKRGVGVKDCESCHLLDNDYKVMPPTTAKSHQPCADSECHADQFFSREPTICSVCHDSFEPFARPKPVMRDRRESEFGGDLSHVSHTKKVGSGAQANDTCEACHGDVYAGTEPPGGGHATCAPCHGKTAEPAMKDCGGCHELGEGRGSLAGGGSKWSVAATFTHDSHENDPREGSGETKCVECHQSIPKAQKLSDIENPTMPSCDGCHDGELAFKTTGFECYRCHGEQ